MSLYSKLQVENSNPYSLFWKVEALSENQYMDMAGECLISNQTILDSCFTVCRYKW